MKNLSTHILIVSCYQKDLPEVGNAHNHYELLNRLRLLEVPFTEGVGYNEGVTEKIILLEGEHKRVAEMICKMYNQNTYFEHNTDRMCYSVHPSGVRDKIGEMLEVTKEDTIDKDFFTFIPETNRYFVAA